MVALVTPSETYRGSFLAAQRELGADAKVIDDAAFAALLVDIAATRTREAFIGRISIRQGRSMSRNIARAARECETRGVG